MLAVLFVIFGLVSLVLSPFAFFQIITKAGFSGWWTFVPYTPSIVTILGAGVFRTVSSDQSVGTTFTELGLWDLFIFLSGIFVLIMFFIFAFAAWPALQPYRPRQRVQPGWPGGGPGQPSWVNAPQPGAASPYGAATPATPPAPPMAAGQQVASLATPAQPSGWYRSGVVGSGEQGYWDGQAWTARRQWKNGAWVDLPVPAQSPVEAGTVDAN